MKGRTAHSHLICSECDNVNTIVRLQARMKKDGFVNNLWCYKCKTVTAHIEDKRMFSLVNKN